MMIIVIFEEIQYALCGNLMVETCEHSVTATLVNPSQLYQS